MISIKCVNPQCTSPSKSFDWDKTEYARKGFKPVKAGTAGASSLVIKCLFCRADNKVWVNKNPTFSGQPSSKPIPKPKQISKPGCVPIYAKKSNKHTLTLKKHRSANAVIKIRGRKIL